MGFCGGLFPYPNELGLVIANLKSGDEVVILKNEGFPPVAKETATIIWKVDGFSALAANGTQVSCNNVSDLIVTGRRFETYTVSSEALRVYGENLIAKNEAKIGK